MTNHPLIIAHRGYSARFPENTVVSCHAAIDAGADLVEADARFSADGTVFCLHDPDLLRLTGNPATVAESRDVDLRAIRVGGQEPPATLPEILCAAKGRSGVLVDVKIQTEKMTHALHDALTAAGWPEDIWLGIRSVDQVRAVRALMGDRVNIVGLIPVPPDSQAFLAAGVNAVRFWESEIGGEDARAVRGVIPVWITTGGRGSNHPAGDTDETGLAAILAYGPAGILVNDPTLIKAPVPS